MNNQILEVTKGVLSRSILGNFSIKHRCPYCEKELTSKENEIGKPDECPLCGEWFVLSKRFLEAMEQQRELKQQKKTKKLERDAERIKKVQDDWDRENKRIQEVEEKEAKRKYALTACGTCEHNISPLAKSCPQCGAPSDPTTLWSAGALYVIGSLIVIVFSFFYDTTINDMHNIGLLNNRLCGIILGTGILVSASVISCKSK
mgnify:CR=1 FL=1